MITTTINSLTKKAENSDTTYQIAVKQFLVEPLRGSTGVNNLEEQFLLGVDCVTTEQEDSSTHVKTIVQEFRNADSVTTNYYTITSTIQPELSAGYTAAYTEIERHVLSFVSAAGTITVATKVVSKKKENNITSTKTVITNSLAG
jgi:hypothetical protein